MILSILQNFTGSCKIQQNFARLCKILPELFIRDDKDFLVIQKGKKPLQSQRRHNECKTFSKNEIAVGSFEVLFSLYNSISGRQSRNTACSRRLADLLLIFMMWNVYRKLYLCILPF